MNEQADTTVSLIRRWSNAERALEKARREVTRLECELANAFKKIIRRGNGAKSERQDLEEAKQSIDRYLRDEP